MQNETMLSGDMTGGDDDEVQGYEARVSGSISMNNTVSGTLNGVKDNRADWAGGGYAAGLVIGLFGGLILLG